MEAMDKRDVPAPIPPAVEPPHRDSVNPPPHPWQEGPQGAAEGPETSRTVERAFTPPGAVPAAPKAPGSLTTNPPVTSGAIGSGLCGIELCILRSLPRGTSCAWRINWTRFVRGFAGDGSIALVARSNAIPAGDLDLGQCRYRPNQTQY